MSKAIVHFLLEDMEVEVPVGASLQEIVEVCQADITFGCRNGTCGTCRIHVEEGLENLSPLLSEEKDYLHSICAENHDRLACQVKIKGNCSTNYVGLT